MFKQKLIQLVLNTLSRLTGKQFLYIRLNENNAQGKTAVEDESGVWHVGNVYDSNDIAYGIAQNGIVERNETTIVDVILGKIAREKQVVFYDIGANIGYYGLRAATLYGAQVHSFEPTPVYVRNIKTAARLNHVEDLVQVHQIALSNKSGTANFHQSGSGSSLEKDFNLTHDLPIISVHTISLDTFVRESTLARPNFMKIDVEGHELPVLLGSQETLKESFPVILLELCTTLKDIGRQYVNPNYSQTVQTIIDTGYVMWHLTESGTLIKWDVNKTIDRAGMFLCLYPQTHEKLKTAISSFIK